MSFGLGKLRLTPTDFWQMTLSEMNSAIDGFVGTAAFASSPSRQVIENLMSQHPDNCPDISLEINNENE